MNFHFQQARETSSESYYQISYWYPRYPDTPLFPHLPSATLFFHLPNPITLHFWSLDSIAPLRCSNFWTAISTTNKQIFCLKQDYFSHKIFNFDQKFFPQWVSWCAMNFSLWQAVSRENLDPLCRLKACLQNCVTVLDYLWIFCFVWLFNSSSNLLGNIFALELMGTARNIVQYSLGYRECCGKINMKFKKI